ncbi:MAG: peptidase S41 [Lysobacterales bacterium CG_4_10_14_3_um_filter_64_11]|nr:MAG: peptidase S41 [Xanthomonadales bacterium CG_4_10_14_3_um_filter_64_11]
MNLRTVLFLCCLVAAPALAQTESASKSGVEADATVAPEAEGTVPLADIQRFVSVYRAVRQGYVDELPDRKVMQAALRGLLTDLDPHSAYLDKEQAQGMDEFANGSYDGVGVELVQLPDRSLRVIAPIDGTPAARAGLLPGDVIIAIDGKPVDVDNADAGKSQLRGEPGTSVVLRVLREDQPQPLELTIERDTIRVTSVRACLLEPRYGYVRISTFQSETGAELGKVIAGIQSTDEPLRGLVLDLRSNPGGVLGAAVEAADAFLDAGLIVATKGRTPFSNARFNATRGDLLNGAPIVILVDGGSASASEVLAAALRDHRRALIMGERTFGKGTVQTVLPLDNGDAIKLTTARYYTPSGGSIQARGIRPDIVLKAASFDEDSDEILPRESDLPGHLQAADAGSERGEREPGKPAADSDYAIHEALIMLKGLSVFGDKAAAGNATEDAASATPDAPAR